MKAIPVAEPCLTYHGADERPEIMGAVGALHPKDQAMRGAFTLSRTLN